MVVLYFFIFFCLVLFLLYRYSTSNSKFWANHDVPYIPQLPFFLTSLGNLFTSEPLVALQDKGYQFFGDSKFGGTFIFGKPSLFLKDPDLIEQILIKDFTVFYNRSLNRDPNISPLSRTLLSLENAQWKNLRTKLTPAFSASKMKTLHQGMVDCCEDLIDYLATFADRGEPLNVKKTMARFMVYSIGSLAFGLRLNTLKDPECKFAKMAEAASRPSLVGSWTVALSLASPWLAGRLLGLSKKLSVWTGSEEDYSNFFMSVIKETADYREKNNIQRNDFLQILMELRKQEVNSDDELKFDLELMTASAFTFLLAGNDTSASTISFLLYEISKNEEVQERLLQEILEVLKRYGGIPTYEALKEMKYLDQVLSETLRMYPPIPSTFRVSRSYYQVPGSSVILPEGTFASVPIYSLHHDPKYFPDPEKFDPDRFADSTNIKKGTYLPFGDGPRICIGQRLAAIEVKLAIITTLPKYMFTVNEKTQTPFKYATKTFFLDPVGGIWLNVSRRI